MSRSNYQFNRLRPYNIASYCADLSGFSTQGIHLIKLPKLCQLVAVLCLLHLYSPAVPAVDVSDASHHEYINLAPHSEFILDKAEAFDIASIVRSDQSGLIPWRQLDSEVLNLGFTNSPLWVKLKLRNHTSESVARFIEVAYPLLDEVVLFPIIDGELLNSIRMGHGIDFSTRPVDHRNPVFPITVPPHAELTVFLRVYSQNALQLPLRLWEPDTFWQQDQNLFLLHALSFGFILSMILYHVFIAWGTGERIYLIYIGLLTANLMFTMAQRGFAFQFLWPKSPHWNADSLALFIPLVVMFAALFTMEILNTKSRGGGFHRLFQGIVLFSMIAMCGVAFLPYNISIPLGTAMAIAIALSTTSVSFYFYRSGEPEVRIFALAWVIWMLGALVLGLNKFGVIPVNSFSEYTVQIGSAIETILLSLAMVVRINRLKKDSLRLQQAELDAKAMELKAIEERREGKAKTEFLAMMSHEIRTPMNGVLGLIDVLKHSELNGRQRHLIDTIQSSGEMLLTILNDILDFSKADADKLDLESVPIDLVQLVDECSLTYGVKARHKGLLFVTYCASSLPKTIQGDPTRIKQIINNLLGNAFKFTEQGHVSLMVDVANQQGAPVLRFQVTDSGIGLTSEQARKLFKSFTQADRSTTRKYGGTGLGLAISKKLVEAMGGEIGVQSEPNSGAVFWFTIPIAEYADVSPINQKPKRVLVCSDYQPLLNLCHEVFSKEGFQSDTLLISADQFDAEWLSRRSFDCWLGYFKMPVGNNAAWFESINQSQANAHKQFVFVESSYNETDYGEHKLNDYNSKVSQCLVVGPPVELHQLIAQCDRPAHKDTSALDAVVVPDPVANLRVLVAEDNAVNQMVIRGLLAPMVSEIDVVNNGKEALERYKAQSLEYDIIFMDCEMPEMDGYEAAHLIREWERTAQIHRPITIVALTAHAFDQFKQKALDSGMNDHLSKPINSKMLKTYFIKFCEKTDQERSCYPN
ncbi:MAG: ATP-binding protein [Pseudomonadales bacterium]|nr:ATP-binding protein [Pseudomonadales bacterium]